MCPLSCMLWRRDQVSNLAVLLSLKMRKNQLISVPPEVFLIETLTLLDLTGNAIRELPEEQLGAAVVLKGLLLSGERGKKTPKHKLHFYNLLSGDGDRRRSVATTTCTYLYRCCREWEASLNGAF